MLSDTQKEVLRDIITLNPDGLYCSRWSQTGIADMFFMLDEYKIPAGIYLHKEAIYQVRKSNGIQSAQCAEPPSYSISRIEAEEL